MTKSGRRRVTMMLLLVAAVAVAVPVFVLMHSGDAGVGNCYEGGSSGPGTLSWWPPGSVCRGGEPQLESVAFDGKFVLVAVTLLYLAFFAGIALERRRASPAG